MDTNTTGFFSRLPAEEYFALPGISISRLKELRRSPQHFQYALTHPKVSKALTLGSAVHCAILEPERFDAQYAVWDSRTDSGAMSPRRGKAWDAFCAEHAGRSIIMADERDDAMTMQAAVRGNPLAMRYLQAGEPELTMRWVIGPRECRGRIDWLTRVDGKPVIVGLKSARDCRPFIFGSQSAKLGYHLQWAYYMDGYQTLKGEEPEMIEIVVESDAPHAVAVYRIPSDIIEQGREEYVDLLGKLTLCEERNEWPGPVSDQEPEVLTLPTWAYSQEADNIADLDLE